MKFMWPPKVAIFFMTYFYRARGHGPLAPPSPRSATAPAPDNILSLLYYFFKIYILNLKATEQSPLVYGACH